MNEKPTLYLHIGAHKTGTSSLQQALKFMYEEDQGTSFLYPTAGRLTDWPVAHHQLVYDLQNGIVDSLNEIYRESQGYISSGGNTVVISCEDFSNNIDLNLIGVVKETFFEFDVKVVLILRNYYEWFESIYLERVKRFVTTLPFKMFLEEHRDYYLFSRKIEYLRLNNIKFELFFYGDINLNSRLFEMFVGKCLPDFYVKNRWNKSLSAEMTMLMREIHNRYPDTDGNKLVHHSYELENFIGSNSTSKTVWGEEEFSSFKRYLKLERAYFERVFPKHADALFKVPSKYDEREYLDTQREVEPFELIISYFKNLGLM